MFIYSFYNCLVLCLKVRPLFWGRACMRMFCLPMIFRPYCGLIIIFFVDWALISVRISLLRLVSEVYYGDPSILWCCMTLLNGLIKINVVSGPSPLRTCSFNIPVGKSVHCGITFILMIRPLSGGMFTLVTRPLCGDMLSVHFYGLD